VVVVVVVVVVVLVGAVHFLPSAVLDCCGAVVHSTLASCPVVEVCARVQFLAGVGRVVSVVGVAGGVWARVAACVLRRKKAGLLRGKVQISHDRR